MHECQSLWVSALCLVQLGCGAERAAAAATGLEDAATDAAGDAVNDAAELPFPAFKPDIGVIVNGGGFIVSTPEIVTVTWSSDPLGSQLEAFGDKLGASKYWASLKEYGVLSTGSPDHVVITTPSPAVWVETDLENWVAMQLQDPTSGWPTPTLNTIYILYTPPSTSITSGGVVTQCPTQGGAHGLFPGADNPNVPVALVIGSCAWTEQEDSDTTDASLLLADSATDPGNQAWNGYDQAHFAWELYADGLSEIGGACSLYAEDYFRPGIDLPYAVGRFWSNASAKEGHDPCVPAVPGAYYNATPLGMTAIDVNVGGNGVPSQQVRTRGYRIPPGQTRTFQVGLYSDAPTSAWDVQAVEGDGVVPPPGPILEISTDKSGGNNGDEINVTVKVRRTPAGQTGVLMTVLSTQNQLQHAVPILIGTY